MIIRLDPAFLKRLRELPLERQVEVLLASIQIPAAFAFPGQHTGLGLRKIHPKGYWEIRVGLSLRVAFRLEKNLARLMMLGDHDDVRRFLRTV